MKSLIENIKSMFKIKNDTKKNLTYRNELLNMLAELENDYYQNSEIEYLKTFTHNYKPDSDFSAIQFSWNGKHGDTYLDSNQKLREKVAIYISLNSDQSISTELLRDLVQEMAKASAESWGAPEYLGFIAEQLLIRTKAKYIDIFGEMLFKNMDTYGACMVIDFSEIKIDEILKSLYEIEKPSKLYLDLIEYFECQRNEVKA